MRGKRFYIMAWGHWFCMVHGWVPGPERVRAVSTGAAAIILVGQPGAIRLEVSA